MKTLTTTQKLKALCESGVTLTEIARLTGIPQPTVWRIANGKHSQPLERNVMLIDGVYQQHFSKADGSQPAAGVSV